MGRLVLNDSLELGFSREMNICGFFFGIAFRSFVQVVGLYLVYLRSKL